MEMLYCPSDAHGKRITRGAGLFRLALEEKDRGFVIFMQTASEEPGLGHLSLFCSFGGPDALISALKDAMKAARCMKKQAETRRSKIEPREDSSDN